MLVSVNSGSSGAPSFLVEIEDALLIPKLDRDDSAFPIGWDKGAVVDLLRSEVDGYAIDLRSFILVSEEGEAIIDELE